MRFKFQTSLDIIECKKRLQEGIAKRGQKGSESHPLIVGSIKGYSFTLAVRRYVNIGGVEFLVRTSFPRACVGKLISGESKTFISGSFGMHPIALGILIWWSLIVAIMSSGVIYSATTDLLAERNSLDNLIPAYLISGLLIGITILFYFLGHLIAPDDPKTLLSFIKDTLEAK